MESKIQLLHPDGKKAIRMDQTKYDLLGEALLNHLKIYGVQPIQKFNNR